MKVTILVSNTYCLLLREQQSVNIPFIIQIQKFTMVEGNEQIDIDTRRCKTQLRDWIVKCSDLITILSYILHNPAPCHLYTRPYETLPHNNISILTGKWWNFSNLMDAMAHGQLDATSSKCGWQKKFCWKKIFYIQITPFSNMKKFTFNGGNSVLYYNFYRSQRLLNYHFSLCFQYLTECVCSVRWWCYKFSTIQVVWSGRRDVLCLAISI